MQHKARKRFGQNFLTDRNIIARIVQSIAPEPGQSLIEIGPGQGAITELLLQKSGRLTVIEIDRDLALILRERFGSYPGFLLHETDVLKFDFNNIPRAEQKRDLRIIGNLPYNISSPLLFHLLQYHERIRDMLFMLQLEVVERLAAEPGSGHYGRLSVIIQYYCQVEKLFRVPATAFRPIPKVESAIVKLTPHATLPHPAHSVRTLEQVLRLAFNQRRKTIRNSLKTLLSATQLTALGVDPGLRAENLSLADYVRISNSIDDTSDEGSAV